MPEARVVLGFDYGTKRIGVAVGQMITKTAKPLTTLATDQAGGPWTAIAELIDSWRVDTLVVGIPLNIDGSEQKITQQAREFMRALERRYRLPVYGCDERCSTVEARQQVFDRGGYRELQRAKIDSVAAQVILESWMTSHEQAQ
jgi:putative holliday junction resolvase